MTSRLPLTTVAVVALTAAIAGCGGSSEADSAASGTVPATATATTAAGDAPAENAAGSTKAKLAASRRNAGEVIDGDIEKTLASLKGVPVVVKQWASWCPQCRREFPYFQALAGKYGSKVAFVGLNARDDRADAAAYSAKTALKFPSIFDGDGSQSAAIGAGRSWPTTVIFDAEGNRAVVKPGAFASQDELEDYIRRFALKS